MWKPIVVSRQRCTYWVVNAIKAVIVPRMEKLDFLVGIISEENNALHDIVQAIEANGNASTDGLYTFFRYKYYSYKS